MSRNEILQLKKENVFIGHKICWNWHFKLDADKRKLFWSVLIIFECSCLHLYGSRNVDVKC